jgi:radical SAM superfamily enzyme YgiQ (UPF0313 family)
LRPSPAFLADGGACPEHRKSIMHRPKKIITTDEAIYDAILAELSDLNEMTAATHAHNVVARLKEHNEPSKVSDITGFPEDDDIEAEEIQRQEQEFEEIVVFKGRRRIPGMPKDLTS